MQADCGVWQYWYTLSKEEGKDQESILSSTTLESSDYSKEYPSWQVNWDLDQLCEP